MTSQWDTGFVAAVDVRNAGAAPATWVVEISYAVDIVITNVWNATVERAGNVYRFRANSGSALAAGQSVQFGYMAGAPRGASRPSRCAVNGHTCE